MVGLLVLAIEKRIKCLLFTLGRTKFENPTLEFSSTNENAKMAFSS